MSQGKISVESIDDAEDMQFADEAFDILGFSREEKYNVYKVTASVMHLGEFKFKQKSSKDEQAVKDEIEAAKKVRRRIFQLSTYYTYHNTVLCVLVDLAMNVAIEYSVCIFPPAHMAAAF